MVLDSNGSCDGERRMLCEMRSAMLLERMTATRWKLADDLGTFWRLLPCGRRSRRRHLWNQRLEYLVSPEALNSKAGQLSPAESPMLKRGEATILVK